MTKMIITTVQWNIGGGLIRDKNSDKAVDQSYDTDGLKYIVNKLREINSDIITFQEIHEGDFSQTKEVSEALEMSYFVINPYDNSHLNKQARLSQSIISKYPLSNHKYQMFTNPGFKVTINGKQYPCHDKGITSVDAKINGDILRLETLHLIPFGRTEIDPLSKKAFQYREDISSKIATDSKRFLLQGDFNFDNDSLKAFIPMVFSEGTKEILQKLPTRATGKRYDHVVYRGMELVETRVWEDALTDHYPIVSTFLV